MRPWLVGLSVLCSCAHGLPAGGRTLAHQAYFRPLTPPSPPRSEPAQRASSDEDFRPQMSLDDVRTKLVVLAEGLVGKKDVELNGQTYPRDCAGLVLGLYEQIGLPLLGPKDARDNAVTAIYRYAQTRGRLFTGGHPLPGDLVFFRDTYDLNRDGRSNDGLTHVGIVEEMGSDNTVTIIHRVTSGVVRYRMNLSHPNQRVDPKRGTVLNDALRNPRGGSRVLTGQLFAAYATVLPSPATASRE